MKEKLIYYLGTFGIILFYIIRFAVAALPFIFIDLNFLLMWVLIMVEFIMPISVPVFWVWGLINAINSGVQDVFAIIYFIASAVVFLPFIIDTIISILSMIKNKR